MIKSVIYNYIIFNCTESQRKICKIQVFCAKGVYALIKSAKSLRAFYVREK